jgi:cysteine-S-conjugate beta-lyase
MKIYDFDLPVDRLNTNCEKWDGRERVFGREDIIPMWVADTDFRTPDFIVKAVQERAAHEVYGYPTKPDSYFNSIISWLKSQHQWNVERDWISYSPNVVIALASTVLSMTKPGDKIIVQPPVYFPFFHVVEGNDRVMVENPLKEVNGRFYFDLDDLEDKIDADTKMLLLCNPHNPGGMVWTKEELTALGNLCLKHNIIIVSDEIHADLVFSGYKHTPFASISEAFAQNCVTTMAASKTFNIAGLSSAFLVIPGARLHNQYKRFMGATHISSGNFFGLVATEAAFTHGREWLKQLMVYLEANLQLVESNLGEQAPEIGIMKPEGTYLVWLDFRSFGLSDSDLSKLLVDHGVGLSPGYLFGAPGNGHMRLNIGCPRKQLYEALTCIVRAVKSIQ